MERCFLWGEVGWSRMFAADEEVDEVVRLQAVM